MGGHLCNSELSTRRDLGRNLPRLCPPSPISSGLDIKQKDRLFQGFLGSQYSRMGYITCRVKISPGTPCIRGSHDEGICPRGQSRCTSTVLIAYIPNSQISVTSFERNSSRRCCELLRNQHLSALMSLCSGNPPRFSVLYP